MAHVFKNFYIILVLIFLITSASAADICTAVNTIGQMNQTPNMTAGEQGIQGIPGSNGSNGLNNMTMNQTPNMTAGATGASGSSGGLIFYFNHSSSPDIGGYEGLGVAPAGNIEADETATVSSGGGQILIDPYITYLGQPGIASLPAGLWRFRTFNYVDNSGGVTTVVFKVYNRTSSGTETLLFTATSDEINDLVVNEYLTSYVQIAPYTISITDRIVIKVYGQTTSTSNKIIHFVYDGAIHTSHIQTPITNVEPNTLTFAVRAGEILKKGQAVYISGASGNDPIVSLSDNTNQNKTRVVGLITSDLTTGSLGTVRRSGILTSIDSRGTNIYINPNSETWLPGDLLFTTTNGGLTKIRPTSGRIVKAAYTMLGSNSADILLAYPMENPIWATAASGENIILRLGDDIGATNISIRNYSNWQVAYIDSLGRASFNGSSSQMNQTPNMTAGLDGVDGTSATIYVNDTFTSESGSYASVINIGTSNDAAFDFTIPRGVQGVNGTPGLNGTNGLNNMTMNLTANMTAGAPGLNNMTMNLTANMTMNQTPGVAGSPGSSGGKVYFFSDTSQVPPPNGFHSLELIPSGNTEVDDTVIVSSTTGDVFIDSYMTNASEPGVLSVPGGLRKGYTYHYVNNSNGVTQSLLKAYLYHLNGTETYLFTQTTSDIDATGVTLYQTAYVNPNTYTINATDRLVLRLYGRSDSVSPVELHFIHDGTSHTSYIQTTFGQPAYIRVDGLSIFASAQSMGGFNLTNLLNPVGLQDAATKYYVDSVNTSMKAYVDAKPSGGDTSNFLLLNGTRGMTANLSMGGFNISKVLDPVAPQDAATKKYVDNEVNLSATYPIGSVYITTLPTNPNTIFEGFGTWNNLGNGYVLVGV